MHLRGFFLSKFSLMLYLFWVPCLPYAQLLPTSSKIYYSLYPHTTILAEYTDITKTQCLDITACLLLRWEVLQWCGFKLQIWVSQPIALPWLFFVCNSLLFSGITKFWNLSCLWYFEIAFFLLGPCPSTRYGCD